MSAVGAQCATMQRGRNDVIRAVGGRYRGRKRRRDWDSRAQNGWLEDYIAQVHGGEPLGCVVLIRRDANRRTRCVTASYRPRSSLMLFSRLLGEKFAGTPIGEQFASGKP